MNNIELSTKMYNNAEVLIKKYKEENTKVNTFLNVRTSRKIDKDFVIVLYAMMSLMSELDQQRTLNMLDEYNIFNKVRRTAIKIKKRQIKYAV